MTDLKDRDVIIKLVRFNATSKKIIDKLDETTLPQNVVDALLGANSPSTTNVYATMDDVNGGGITILTYAGL